MTRTTARTRSWCTRLAKSRWARVWVTATVGVVGLSGCGDGLASPDDAGTSKVLIAAASDLRFAFTEVGKQFAVSTGVTPTFTFGSSGQLKEQIINGAPFDVFASANEQFVLDVVAAQRGLTQTVQTYGWGRIVMRSRPGREVPTSIADLVRADITRIAIANPAHAPYGIAAREALQAAGIYTQVQPKLIFGDNVSDALRLVETGNVDVAIVALSLVVLEDELYEMIPENLHSPLRQAIVVTTTGDNQNNAHKFVEFVMSDRGRRVMASYGFVVPEEDQ